MSKPAYFDLAIPAPRRLAMMREDFASHSARYPHCPECAKPRDWRGVRGSTLQGVRDYFGLPSIGSSDGTPVVYGFKRRAMPVRFIRYCDEVRNTRVEHAGWFTDDECDEKARGIVGALSHGRFLAGYAWSSNGENVLFCDRVYSDESEAARMADEHARVFADQAREDSERFNAMQDAETFADEKETDVREAWDAYRLAWQARYVSVRHLANAHEARNDVSDAIDELRQARADRVEKTAAYERS